MPISVTWKTSGTVSEVRPDALTAIVSREDVDRDGEVIDLKGLGRARFAEYPLMLCDHDTHKIIGAWPRLWEEPIGGLPALLGEARRGPGPVAEQVWSEIAEGVRRGISVGLTVQEVGGPVRPGQWGKTIVRSELVEVSSVAIPACPDCLVLSIGPRQKCACPPGEGVVREALQQLRLERGARALLRDPRPLAAVLARAMRPAIDWEVRREVQRALRGGR
jgi:hypothetical protein